MGFLLIWITKEWNGWLQKEYIKFVVRAKCSFVKCSLSQGGLEIDIIANTGTESTTDTFQAS